MASEQGERAARDRQVARYESEGWGFESLRARRPKVLGSNGPPRGRPRGMGIVVLGRADDPCPRQSSTTGDIGVAPRHQRAPTVKAMDTESVRTAVMSVRDTALARVRDDRGVRVEDYLTVLASLTGEAVVVDAGLFDIEQSDMTPGAPVFGDELNVLLSGDSTDIAEADPLSVVGVVRDQLVPGVLGPEGFPSLQDLYQIVAGNVGELAWGTVATSVPEDHQPEVLPLQVAFELRPAVSEAIAALAAELGSDCPSRHVLCALALASAIAQTADALDPVIGLRLALEVVFGMAKTVPMSSAAMSRLASED